MVSVKPYSKYYLEDIDRIWNKHYKGSFSLPNLDSTITSLVAVRGDNLIAFGMVKIFAEAIMVMDKEAPLKDKVQANEMLLAQGFDDSREHGLEQLHVIVEDAIYAELLKNKYGFLDVNRRILVKHLK